MKQANVCVYTTLMFRVNGVEGENDKEIIEEAVATLHREDIDQRINTTLVDPTSPTARNMMGEIVHWQLDLDGSHLYQLSDTKDEDDSLRFYEDHPLKMEPRIFEGDTLSDQAFKLIAELAEQPMTGESEKLKELIKRAQKLAS